MEMTTPAPRTAASASPMPAMPSSSSLFWGDRGVVVLFAGWPGDRGLGAYLLCLIFVLVLAALAEALHAVSTYFVGADHHHRRRRAGAGGAAGDVGPAILTTAVHAARVGAGYLLMLAVMSLNGGVLLAAVAGHALGFLLTRSWAAAAGRAEAEHEHGTADGAGNGRGSDLGGGPPSDGAGKA